MKRREFITLLGGAAAALPVKARAQSPKSVSRVGVLMSIANDDEGQARLAAIQMTLAELGWRETRNIEFDVRWAGGDLNQIRHHAKQIVERNPDVIFASSGRSTIALRQETKNIPIVFAGLVDPIGSGLVASLNKPGGNVTGFMNAEGSLSGKWLGLLKEIAPQVVRFGLLVSPENPAAGEIIRSFKAGTTSLTGEPFILQVRNAVEIERQVADFAEQLNVGLVVPQDLTIAVHRKLILDMAQRRRLPAIYGYPSFARNGGLMSYGIDLIEVYRRSASYLDRILKGEKPGDLPVQAPTKYELVINLKTTKALGIVVPPTLLARADEVIE